jgi:nucleolar pre-ribosomal-associated protein 1
MSTFSAVLTLLSAHYTDHSVGHPIMKMLLQPVRLRCMNAYIGGSHNELIITTLKLYNVMSNFASGRDRNSVMEGFGWDIKVFFLLLLLRWDYLSTLICDYQSLPKLLKMRRRTAGTVQPDPLLRPGKFHLGCLVDNLGLISRFQIFGRFLSSSCSLLSMQMLLHN